MRLRRSLSAFALPALLTLSGCGYVHLGRIPVAAPAPAPAIVTDEKLTKENTDLRLEKKMLQQELALTRAQGDALRMAIENRAADGNTSARLVDRLNESSRELATLRASYAQLQADRNQAVASAAEASALRTRLGATEEKLAQSLRTYTELQGEISRLRADVDRTRADNIVLTEKVRTVTAQNAEAQATLTQLNTELLTQKDARLRAEEDATTLRTELAAVAPNASALARQRTGAAAAASSLVAEHAAETAALKEQLKSLRGKIETLTSERAGLQEQLTAGGKTPREPAPELANVEAQLATALRDASNLRDENHQLKTVSTQLESQLSQLRSGPADVQVQSLREQLHESQTQANALVAENSRLRSRLVNSPGQVVVTNPASVVPPGANPRPVVHLNELNNSGNSVSATLVVNTPGGARPAIVRNNDAGGQTRFHVVVGGDTLAKISDQYYGTPGRWGEILAANRDVLGETNNLVVGKTLRIP